VVVTETHVMEALRPVQDPELRRSIVNLGMVRGIRVDGHRVEVRIALTAPECPMRAEIQESVDNAVSLLDGVEAVKVDFTVMTDEQLGELRERLHGDPSATAGTNSTYGHSEGRAVPFAEANSTTRVLLIASGKGGVGKSSVTTNLAVALAARGRDVAVVDADVWGFSIPRMLGVTHPPTVIDGMLIPPEAHGVRCISMGFFADEDQPIIWRGPMLHKALEQFLTDVYWDEPDYLIVDLPPGTGDISISLAGFLPTAEMYVVTTPQVVAQSVAQRAAFMAEKVNLKVHGIIENMSWFTGDDGTRYELFGAGGGRDLADRLEVPLVGQVPLVPALRDGADNGRPVAGDPSTEVGALFAEMARTIDVDMKPTKRRHKELRII
jgi:ATP-binding protein involved in chromosome partitioning